MWFPTDSHLVAIKGDTVGPRLPSADDMTSYRCLRPVKSVVASSEAYLLTDCRGLGQWKSLDEVVSCPSQSLQSVTFLVITLSTPCSD